MMTCRAILFNETNNKVLKVENVTRDTYPLCQEEIDKRNMKLKYPKKWTIIDINV